MGDKTLDYYLNLNYEVSLRRLTEEEGGGWLASIPLLPGCMSDGETPGEALANLEDAKRGWIETALMLQRDIPEPDNTEKYSGKFTVRLPKSLHRALAAKAQEDGVSLNQMAIYLLSLGLGKSAMKKKDS
ncbi:toxin-antitoxin system HicB family antitoxin [Neomoorella carbonis]|uniref:toxin-antitoxin system HicB family antitoxin n=1 Tax=Neomoorella carbonis TaxID=3062783 RepID=UPI00324A63B0